jgi:hypothetical protein
MEKTLLDYVLGQGIGVVFGAAILYIYIRERKENTRRLVGIIHERKTDRDQLLLMLGRLDAHLGRAAAFEEFSRVALREAADPDNPHRRRHDLLLQAALEREREIARVQAEKGDPPTGP